MINSVITLVERSNYGSDSFDDKSLHNTDSMYIHLFLKSLSALLSNTDADKPKPKKLGPIRTYFTLLKGFLGTGILYLPQSVYEGGWLFTLIAFFLSFVLTTLCMQKLL